MDTSISTQLHDIPTGISQPTVNPLLHCQQDCTGKTLRAIAALHQQWVRAGERCGRESTEGARGMNSNPRANSAIHAAINAAINANGASTMHYMARSGSGINRADGARSTGGVSMIERAQCQRNTHTARSVESSAQGANSTGGIGEMQCGAACGEAA